MGMKYGMNREGNEIGIDASSYILCGRKEYPQAAVYSVYYLTHTKLGYSCYYVYKREA